MNRIYYIRIFFLSIFRHFFDFLIFLKYIRNEEILENKDHIVLAASWLLKAQDKSADGGGIQEGIIYTNAMDGIKVT